MAENTVERKLRAILVADVVGYSRLMGEDEEGTLTALKAHRVEFIDPIIGEHRGRIVKLMGDGVLIEFASVVDALKCAIAVQRGMTGRNAKVPEERQIVFRIGINLGDVIIDGDDIYGNGVNVAARLEALAEPGGICISGRVFNQVEKNVEVGFAFLGPQRVKNIDKPINAYKVLLGPEAAGTLVDAPKAKARSRVSMVVASVALVVALAVAGYWHQHSRPDIEPASVEKMVHPLPDKPSIAVLPFENMSGDPKQEYFSDGFTEHIITSLSKVPYIFVIARQSSFSFRDKQMPVQQIAKELGVRYILEGSIQRSGKQLRITVQLIDATSGHHIWADNYDRKLTDIFALQDEIAMKIMAELQLELTVEELGNLSATRTKNIKAYEKYLNGFEHILRRTESDTIQAKKLAEEAISLDPEYGAAYQLLARAYLDDVWFYRTKSAAKSLEMAESLAQKSLDLLGNEATGHRLLCCVYYLRRQYDEAVAECRKALDISPSSAQFNYWYATALRYAGRFDEAITYFKKAIRLNPITPMTYLNNIAWAYYFSEQYEKAIPIWNKCIERNPDYFFAYLGLTLAYQLSGNEFKAREATAEVMRLKPNLTVSKIRKGPATKNYDRERGFQALKKAGIPE